MSPALRTCAICEAEYLIEVRTCMSCGGLTLDADQLALWRSARHQEDLATYVPAAVFDSFAEQGLIMSMLETDEIPALRLDRGLEHFGPAFTAQQGWSLLLVRPEDLAAVQRLVAGVRRQVDAAEDEQGEGDQKR